MQLRIYFNLFAIYFIRCVSRVPNKNINAAGAGFTLKSAIQKCRSELIERSYAVNEHHSNSETIIGIAAHPVESQAFENAIQEAVEDQFVEEVVKSKKIYSKIKLSIFRTSFCLCRSNFGYIAVFKGHLNKNQFAVTSAKRSAIRSILKAWEEYSSVYYFKPNETDLKSYTKINKKLNQYDFESLQIISDKKNIYHLYISNLRMNSIRRSGRAIVYFYRVKENQHEIN